MLVAKGRSGSATSRALVAVAAAGLLMPGWSLRAA